MRYSRGNRGGKSRQWGERRYDPPKVQRKKIPLDEPVTFDLDVYFVKTDDGEKLRYDAVCSACKARHYATDIPTMTFCLCCNRPAKRLPSQ